MSDSNTLAGGCACGALRYRLTGPPLVVHACHCRDCQRLSGGAFVINVWIEADRVEQLAGEPRSFGLRGGSGKPHEVFFCGDCNTAVWSRYHAVPGHSLFVRAGALDDVRREERVARGEAGEAARRRREARCAVGRLSRPLPGAVQ